MSLQETPHLTDPGPTVTAAGLPPTPANTVYGSFWIDDTECGIPVDVIQEVVNAPETLTPIPMSPPHIIGVFCLRDMVVPVVDLRILLGFPEPTSTAHQKVAILENGNLLIGLLFDDTGGVINSLGAKRVEFLPDADGNKDVIVEGVLKLDDGKRIIQILDPCEIIGIKKLPRIAKKEVGHSDEGSLGPRLNCISFQLGHTHCAIDLRYVQEITDVPRINRCQLAHSYIIGSIELRGRTIPVIDFRGMIGNEDPFPISPEMLEGRKLMILKLPQGHVALLVYSIDSIMNFYETDVKAFANVALPRQDLVAGCILKNGTEIVILLNQDTLMADPLLTQAAQSYREIYPSDVKKPTAEEEAQSGKRSTYIVFSLVLTLALDIECVSEIINRPDRLLQPPYGLPFLDGILDLRGELITVLNARKLYALQPSDEIPSKILIFQKDSKKYGFSVDAVNEILTMPSSQLQKIPTFREGDRRRNISEDVAGILRGSGNPDDEDSILVLSVASVLRRCVEIDA